MRKIIFIASFLVGLNQVLAQTPYHFKDSVLVSLYQQLSLARNEDTFRVQALNALADHYGFLQFDSCLFYAVQTSQLSQKLKYDSGRFLGFRSMYFAYNCQGNYPKALEAVLNMQKTAERFMPDNHIMTLVHYFKGLLYREMKDPLNAKTELRQAILMQQKIGEPMPEVFYAYSVLGGVFQDQHKLDSAFYFAKKGYELGKTSIVYKKYFSLATAALGGIYTEIGNYIRADSLFREGISQSGEWNNIYFQTRNYNQLATLFKRINSNDSSLQYARISLLLCLEHNFGENALVASKILAEIYESEKNPDSAFKYLKIMDKAKDSVFSQYKGQEFRQAAFNEIQREQEITSAKERYQNRVRVYVLLSALGVFSLLAFILYRNVRQKQKAKIQIEKAYEELKSTQKQLIQSEKMASLGELTAGIAHEIQNPLNFVNNFSEVNTELIDELGKEVDKGNFNEVKAIAKDIKENEQKINHHGKRADSIVKGMLLHSQSSTGKKEPTIINALADEYLRLAYHGLRAKEKSFNATMKTNYDESIGKINIISQDIGRVLLNLYNNAFYEVTEKKKQQPEGYEPTVSVSTKGTGDKVIISIKDNGNGIPQKVLDKIFQPFFTTKPAGQGTGLGLSISYDIVKVHGGELKVNTNEGEGTEFIVQIPFV